MDEATVTSARKCGFSFSLANYRLPAVHQVYLSPYQDSIEATANTQNLCFPVKPDQYLMGQAFLFIKQNMICFFSIYLLVC